VKNNQWYKPRNKLRLRARGETRGISPARIKIVLACLMCLALLSACWDSRELEDNSFIILMGIDRADESSIILTIAFPLTQTGDGEKDGGEYSVMSVKAPTINEGLNLLGAKLSGPVSLFSVRTVVISEELAADGQLNKVISSWRDGQVRNTAAVLISSCKAADFIEAHLKNSPIEPLRREELLLEHSNKSSNYKAVQFLDLIESLKTDGGAAVAMYGGIQAASDGKGKEEKEGEEKKEKTGYADIVAGVKNGYLPGEIPVISDNGTQICGLAVFSDQKMAGALDTAETGVYAMLTGSKNKKSFVLPDPLDAGSVIVFSVLPSRGGTVKGRICGGEAVFDIILSLRCSLEFIQSGVDYTLERNYDILTEYIRAECEKNIADLIYKIQKVYDADILELGERLSNNFLTAREFEQFSWEEKYRDAGINLHIKLDIEGDIGVVR